MMDGILEAVGVPVWVVELDHEAANGYPSVPGLFPAARVVSANPAALSLHCAGSLGQLLGRPKPGDRQRRIRPRRDGELDAR